MDRLMCRRHAQRAWGWWLRCSIAEELVAVGEPSLALRILRGGAYGRPRDWFGDQRRIAASAYEALRRPSQAKKMRANPKLLCDMPNPASPAKKSVPPVAPLCA